MSYESEINKRTLNISLHCADYLGDEHRTIWQKSQRIIIWTWDYTNGPCPFIEFFLIKMNWFGTNGFWLCCRTEQSKEQSHCTI